MATRLAVDLDDERLQKLEDWMWKNRIKYRNVAINWLIDHLPDEDIGHAQTPQDVASDTGHSNDADHHRVDSQPLNQ